MLAIVLGFAGSAFLYAGSLNETACSSDNSSSGSGSNSSGGMAVGGSTSGGSSTGSGGGGGTSNGSSSGGNGASSGGSGGGSSGGSSGGGGSSSGGSSGGGSSSSGSGGSSSGSGGGMVGDSVLMHHKNPNRDGVYVEAALTKAAVTAGLNTDPSFAVSLPDPKDAIYAQPLFVDGGGTTQDLVIVATEANNVYALSGVSGAIVWTRNLGTPVPLANMSCGNIDPFGVTGTPVIDWASSTLFVGALVLTSGNAPQHEIFALDLASGQPKSGWPVIVHTVAISGSTTFSDSNHGERGALAIVNGTLYVPYGGLYGDCTPYNGWVLGIPIANPSQAKAWATTLNGGGIWSPAGISSDGTNIYVATGNTFNGAGTWGGGDGVVSFGTGSAFGSPLGFYAPTEWQQLDDGDLDMGPTPVVFDLPGSTPSALAITFGKDGDAYLLDRNNLGGVGNALSPAAGQSYTLSVASNQIISAPVVYSTATAFYAVFKGNGNKCTNATSGSLTAVTIVGGSPPTLAPSWCASQGSGSPMVTTSDGHADAIVWDLGAEADGRLHAVDGDTGATISFPGANVNIPNMRRYNTPIAAKGRIFVPADNTVVAFKP